MSAAPIIAGVLLLVVAITGLVVWLTWKRDPAPASEVPPPPPKDTKPKDTKPKDEAKDEPEAKEPVAGDTITPQSLVRFSTLGNTPIQLCLKKCAVSGDPLGDSGKFYETSVQSNGRVFVMSMRNAKVAFRLSKSADPDVPALYDGRYISETLDLVTKPFYWTLEPSGKGWTIGTGSLYWSVSSPAPVQLKSEPQVFTIEFQGRNKQWVAATEMPEAVMENVAGYYHRINKGVTEVVRLDPLPAESSTIKSFSVSVATNVGLLTPVVVADLTVTVDALLGITKNKVSGQREENGDLVFADGERWTFMSASPQAVFRVAGNNGTATCDSFCEKNGWSAAEMRSVGFQLASCIGARNGSGDMKAVPCGVPTPQLVDTGKVLGYTNPVACFCQNKPSTRWPVTIPMDVIRATVLGGLGSVAQPGWSSTFVDAQARWIWNTADAAPAAHNSSNPVSFFCEYFLNSFTDTLTDADGKLIFPAEWPGADHPIYRLSVMVDATCKIKVNGQLLDTVFKSTTQQDARIYLKTGRNVVEAICTNNRGRAGLILSVYDTKNMVLFRTDATWMCTAN